MCIHSTRQYTTLRMNFQSVVVRLFSLIIIIIYLIQYIDHIALNRTYR